MRKRTIQEIVDSLPDDAEVDVDAFMEKIDVLEKIEAAERQIAAGEVVPHTEVVEQLKPWLK